MHGSESKLNLKHKSNQMSASSMRRGVSAKELPEVFILKKEVQFDAWRQVFSEA